MKIAILGGGLCGLELGRCLKETGQDFTIFEKENQIGGLCRTIKTGDYFWDLGIHAIYSRDLETLNYLRSLPLDYQKSDRNVKIFHRGKHSRDFIINYPFEMGIKELPLVDRLECIAGYLAVKTRKAKANENLQDWIDHQLGAGIAKHFMIPYNRKIWDCDLQKISNRLVNVKIEPAPVMEFILTALGKNTVGRAYQAKFIYPKMGIQALCDFTARDIQTNIRRNADVDKLTPIGKKWSIILKNGETQEADYLISTIPLVELLKKLPFNDLPLKQDVFRWNNTFFIMIGLQKGCPIHLIKDCHWVFFKEDEIFYRLTLMHNLSSGFPPAIVAEITRKGAIVNKSPEEIREQVVRDLVRRNIIESESHVTATDIRLIEYTYPIPTEGLEQEKQRLAQLLRAHNIFLLGRNGNWDYINMDGVIRKVKDFIDNTLPTITAA